MNNKAGVQLAPMNHQPHIAAGRSSMMSINGPDENDAHGSHPILKV